MSRSKSTQGSGPGLGIFFSEEKIPRDESTGWQASSMVVSGLLSGSAAERSCAIHVGDRLWAVGGQSVVGLKPQAVVDLIASVLEKSSGVQTASRKSSRVSMLDDTDKENSTWGHSSTGRSSISGMKGVELTLQRLEEVGSSTRAVPYTVTIPFSSSCNRDSASKTSRRHSSSTRDFEESRRDGKDAELTTEDLEAVPGKKRVKSSTPLRSLNSPRNSAGDRLTRSQAISARKRQRQDNPPVEVHTSASEAESTVMVKRNGTLIKRESIDSVIRTEEVAAASMHAGATNAVSTAGGRKQEDPVFARECKSLREANCALVRRIEELERRAEANELKLPEARSQGKEEAKRDSNEKKADAGSQMRMPEAAVVSLEEERAELEVSAEKERLKKEVSLLSQQREDILRHKEEVTRKYAEVARLREETDRREQELTREREEVTRDQEEVTRERELLAGEKEELARLEKEVARQAEEVRREKEAESRALSLRQQAKLMLDPAPKEESSGGSSVVSQLQDRLKMAVGSARRAKEALGGERAGWEQTAALLSTQVAALASVAQEYEAFALEFADEMKSMDADRVFLEAEILRQQEKHEKTAEKLKKSEEEKAKAEQDIEELRRVVAKEEREREKAEEEWRREQERAEADRERLCRRIEQLEDGAPPVLQREPSVQLEHMKPTDSTSEGVTETERRASWMLKEVLDAQSMAAEVAKRIEEEAAAQERAAEEGAQRLEQRVRQQERRRHSAIVAELRSELKKALAPPSLSPSPHSKSRSRSSEGADSLCLSQSTASPKPSPLPPAAAEGALAAAEGGARVNFLLPSSNEHEKEQENEADASRHRAPLPGEEERREDGETQVKEGEEKAASVLNTQDSGGDGGSKASWNVAGNAV